MFLRLQYCQAGERALYVPLPIDYDTDGAHSLLRRENAWWLVHRFDKLEVRLSEIDDPAGTKRLYLEHNYSDKLATMRDADDEVLNVPCQLRLCMVAPQKRPSSASASGSERSTSTSVAGVCATPQPTRRRLD